jgi:hypothetical protein
VLEDEPQSRRAVVGLDVVHDLALEIVVLRCSASRRKGEAEERRGSAEGQTKSRRRSNERRAKGLLGNT